MTNRPEDLPEFSAPPLSEVVIGLGFERLTQFRQGHFGRFWSEVVSDYPKTWDHERLHRAPVSLAGTMKPRLAFEVLESAPTDRAWFVSGDDTRLVQLQDDRIAHNWRRRDDDDPYPRFEVLAENFKSYVDALQALVRREGIGQLIATDIELTYVNWVEVDTAVGLLAGVQDSPLLGNSSLVAGPTSGRWEFFIGDESARIGRLNVDYGPATGPRGEPGCGLTLSYQQPRSERTEEWDVAADLFRAREWIVRSFAQATTTEFHQKWGRTQ